MSLSEHVYCVAIVFKMTKQVEQIGYILGRPHVSVTWSVLGKTDPVKRFHKS